MPHVPGRTRPILIVLLATVTIAAYVSCAPLAGEEPYVIRAGELENDPADGPRRDVLVGGDHSYPPFEFLDERGEPDGFNIAVLRRVAAIMGLDLTVELTDWSEARRRLQDGAVDMLAGMYLTSEREEVHDFTVPLFFVSYGLFVPSGSEIRGVDDLDDAVILVHEGDLAHDYVLAEGLGREIVTIPEWLDVLSALAAGTGDCAVFGMGQGMREVRRGEYRGVRMLETPLFRRGYGMAVQEGDAELLAILNEGLSILKSTGEFDRIYEAWFGVIETGSWWSTHRVRSVAIALGAGAVTVAVAIGWIIVLRNQVRRKTSQLSAALAESTAARRDLERANEAKLRFLANVSHELRTPLHGVMALTRLLEETPLDEDQHSLVRRIDGASGQLFRVLSDLLDVSRARTGQLSIMIAPFRIREIAEWLEPTLREIAVARGLSFEFSYDGPDVWAAGDRERITQIVINLATNGVKFTESGTVAVGLTYASGELGIVVRDSGRGVADEELEMIFEPFVQAVRCGEDRTGGLGLGLSIVRSLVERLGGSIAVESEPGAGTTFRVTLPLPEAADPATESATPSAAEPSSPELRRDELTILVAEDDAINRLYLRTFLERSGAAVVVADNGARALDSAREQSFDVILMDISMPEMDGLEATKLIREHERRNDLARRPIIALTAHAHVEHAQRFLDAGMSGYVSKPFDEPQVWSEIERVLSDTTR